MEAGGGALTGRLRAPEDGEVDGGSLLAPNFHGVEAGYDGEVNLILFQVSAGNRDGLDCLVDCRGTDCLNLGIAFFTHDAGNGARHCGRT